MKNEQATIEQYRRKLDTAERKVRILEDMIEDRTRELHLKGEENQELELFAYLTSHDLQEPLRTIMSFVEILEEEYADRLDGDGSTALNFIREGADRMSLLIKSLLHYSKVGKNRTRRLVNTNKVVEDILSRLQTSIQEADAKISYGSLPVLNVFEVEWAQLFQNLVHNAIKFRKPDVAPVISIGVQQREDEYLFFVRDNGIGIEEKFREKVFVIFQRLHSNDLYPGTGIGLANCKKIVELHDGKIWLESTVGVGSTFYFTIKK
ncbi:light-regulated signal transduction histidine kinase (bacteriophytochrome) [Lewinella aquimaris]|uniref:histidine kinase n=1 Tax=Neolewinella aquimaris TaxID=1835722 RepID=A0A840EBZ3_9BACT|nr:ATP-binding protein [Neolewinella aquimaris]MBB4079518.1 light-regulated signal transduction histidine kinase (bacteriophytochrome) [Neolewinella aquimaris]